MTFPVVVTVDPVRGLCAPVPWISAIDVLDGTGSGSGVGAGLGSGAVEPLGVGLIVVLRLKSAALLLLSAPPLRFRLLASPVPAGPAAAAVSKVLEEP